MQSLDDYIALHSDREDDYLYRLYRATNVHLLRPRMASGHVQGVLLRMLVEMIRPKNVLEIGTYTGYSALSMAAGLEEDGHLYTFEINDEQEDFTRPWIEGSPWANRIEFHIGNVLDELTDFVAERKQLKFDLAFVDGDKKQYVDYYHLVLRHLNPGGYIIADNTLWDGHVVDPAYDKEKQTIGIRAFNEMVAADERVEKVILPLRDGLTIIRKKWIKE
ncbi:MAG: class I SAM-dependent methyltransferase [Bacteroidaceae bacterium]